MKAKGRRPNRRFYFYVAISTEGYHVASWTWLSSIEPSTCTYQRLINESKRPKEELKILLSWAKFDRRIPCCKLNLAIFNRPFYLYLKSKRPKVKPKILLLWANFDQRIIFCKLNLAMFNRVFYLYLPKADKWKQKAEGRTEDFTFLGQIRPKDTMLQAEFASIQSRNTDLPKVCKGWILKAELKILVWYKANLQSCA